MGVQEWVLVGIDKCIGAGACGRTQKQDTKRHRWSCMVIYRLHGRGNFPQNVHYVSGSSRDTDGCGWLQGDLDGCSAVGGHV